MLLDDPPADRQPQPRPLALLLGGEERVHDPGQVLGRDAHPGVRELDPHGGPAVVQRAGAGAQRQGAALRHGVAGVGEQVQEHLPQLLPVGVDGRHVRGELLHDGDLPLAQVVLDQFDRLGQFLVGRPRSRPAPAPRRENWSRLATRSPIRFVSCSMISSARRPGVVRGRRARTDSIAQADRRQGVVQLVGDAGRQLADAGQLGRLPELLGHGPHFLVLRLQLRHGRSQVLLALAAVPPRPACAR